MVCHHWSASRIAASSAQQRLAKSELLQQHLAEAGRSLSTELKRRRGAFSALYFLETYAWQGKSGPNMYFNPDGVKLPAGWETEPTFCLFLAFI
jgi:hypothetical protein